MDESQAVALNWYARMVLADEDELLDQSLVLVGELQRSIKVEARMVTAAKIEQLGLLTSLLFRRLRPDDDMPAVIGELPF